MVPQTPCRIAGTSALLKSAASCAGYRQDPEFTSFTGKKVRPEARTALLTAWELEHQGKAPTYPLPLARRLERGPAVE